MKSSIAFRRCLPIVFALLLAASLSLGADRATVVVLATTDLHGNIYPLDAYRDRPANRGLAKIASLIAEERKAHPDLILIDCGDAIEGSPIEYVHQRDVQLKGDQAPADPMMLVMNRLRYDAMVVGNHEFNFGLPVLWKARREAKFPWISANIEPSPTEQEALLLKKRQFHEAADQMGERTFEPMLLKTVQGVQVAIIGLTTPAIPSWETPEHIRGYKFEPLADAARYWIKHSHDVRDADVVVLAAHSGLERDAGTGEPIAESTSGENSVYQLAVATHGVDAIVYGHTHREVGQQLLNDVLLVQPRNWGQSLAEITFVLERDEAQKEWKLVEKKSRVIPVTDQTAPDPDVLALAKPYHDAAEAYLSATVARAKAPLDGRLGRVEDSGLLDAIHEVQLSAAKADVSFAALFNPSVSLPAGPVTVRQLAALYLYDNTLFAVELTGAQLKQALEHAAEFYRQYKPGDTASLINRDVRGYNYDTAEGVTYKIDLTQPAGSRIVDLRFHGQPLDPARKLRVAVNSYRKAGGGGYSVFRDAPVLWESHDDIRQLMIDYYTARRVIEARVDNNWEVIPQAAREALIKEASQEPPPQR